MRQKVVMLPTVFAFGFATKRQSGGGERNQFSLVRIFWQFCTVLISRYTFISQQCILRLSFLLKERRHFPMLLLLHNIQSNHWIFSLPIFAQFWFPPGGMPLIDFHEAAEEESKKENICDTSHFSVGEMTFQGLLWCWRAYWEIKKNFEQLTCLSSKATTRKHLYWD